MTRYKHILVITMLIMAVIFSVAAMHPPAPADFKNLQVLPKDISSEALHKIMEVDFGKGLGVNCEYCHTKINADENDFASDAKPEKEISRKMMRMTMDLNQKYFGSEKPFIGDPLSAVSCITCHRGEPFPEVKTIKPQKLFFGL